MSGNDVHDGQNAASEQDGRAAAHADLPYARTESVEAKLRRSPKYGTFMGLGAVIGAVAGWIGTAAIPPVQNEDTTPVIGLMVVVGFVAGGLLGGIAALIAARIVDKRDVTVRAEHTIVERPATQMDAAPEAAAEAVVVEDAVAEDAAGERDREAAASASADELPGSAPGTTDDTQRG